MNRVVDDEDFDETARAPARRLAEGPTRAFAEVKRLVRSPAGLESQLAAEADAIARTARMADAVEGIAAFHERRPAHFAGHERRAPRAHDHRARRPCDADRLVIKPVAVQATP
ncbi:MAG: hypothetical protein KY395_03955 [Actinobacteria bacterium]|nr:hypothetical protein [Actinomycetota bacterium]